MKVEMNKNPPKIKYELKKGKVGELDLYIFPGRQIGNQSFPAFCVALYSEKKIKQGVSTARSFISVMN